MKELTIEQKAKAYDEALEKARNLHKDAIDMGENIRAKQCEIIFPELKGSEDENNKRISKEISRFLKQNNGWNNEWLTWLKKQGEPIDKEKVQIGARMDVALSIINFLDRNTLSMCLSGMERADLESAVVNSDWTKVYAYMKNKLEKQGEQKSFDYENAYFQQKDFAPKVEPKFYKDEWVVNKYGVPWRIDSFDKKNYQVSDGEGTHGYFSILKQNEVHHWTIQDARNGDVLNDGITIFIFKDLLSDGSVLSYCDYNTDSGVSDAFCPLSVNLMCSKITPATKEQRALFFQKMKEAGYEWDAEKKELKIIDFSKHLKCNPDTPSIIEQNPA